jgi:glutaconyl-CoA/methylmalonyl-CoA decarboxylase subunit delta
MNEELNIAVDTVKAVLDTVKHTAGNTKSLQNVSFDLSKMLNSDGILISVIGYIVVFAALVLLYLFFANITKILMFRQKIRLKRSGEKSDLSNEELSMSGEINAAIGMALFLHFEEVHDFENTILTIKKVQKTYSPWSSKIYGLREYPKRK